MRCKMEVGWWSIRAVFGRSLLHEADRGAEVNSDVSGVSSLSTGSNSAAACELADTFRVHVECIGPFQNGGFWLVKVFTMEQSLSNRIYFINDRVTRPRSASASPSRVEFAAQDSGTRYDDRRQLNLSLGFRGPRFDSADAQLLSLVQANVTTLLVQNGRGMGVA